MTPPSGQKPRWQDEGENKEMVERMNKQKITIELLKRSLKELQEHNYSSNRNMETIPNERGVGTFYPTYQESPDRTGGPLSTRGERQTPSGPHHFVENPRIPHPYPPSPHHRPPLVDRPQVPQGKRSWHQYSDQSYEYSSNNQTYNSNTSSTSRDFDRHYNEQKHNYERPQEQPWKRSRYNHYNHNPQNRSYGHQYNDHRNHRSSYYRSNQNDRRRNDHKPRDRKEYRNVKESRDQNSNDDYRDQYKRSKNFNENDIDAIKNKRKGNIGQISVVNRPETRPVRYGQHPSRRPNINWSQMGRINKFTSHSQIENKCEEPDEDDTQEENDAGDNVPEAEAADEITGETTKEATAEIINEASGEKLEIKDEVELDVDSEELDEFLKREAPANGRGQGRGRGRYGRAKETPKHSTGRGIRDGRRSKDKKLCDKPEFRLDVKLIFSSPLFSSGSLCFLPNT